MPNWYIDEALRSIVDVGVLLCHQNTFALNALMLKAQVLPILSSNADLDSSHLWKTSIRMRHSECLITGIKGMWAVA